MHSKFFKAIARIVLASYSLQSLTPFALACDIDHSPSMYDQHFQKIKTSQDIIQGPLTIKDLSSIKASYIPSRDEMDIAQQIIEQSHPATLENYQYKITINKPNNDSKATQFKISRRARASGNIFKTLYKASVDQDQITPYFTASDEAQEDTLLSLCKGSSLINYQNDSMVWHIPGFATINILSNGNVFFDQLSTSPFQSAFDLILKTSQELFIQTLNTKSLTLKSKKTHFSHAVIADQLHVAHEAINEGGLRIGNLMGEGKLINHAYCHFQGTEAKPAVIGLRQVINENRTTASEGARMEGTYLHLTSTNQLFQNSERAEVRLSEILTVDSNSSSSGSSLVNEGALYVKEATLNRQTSNSGFWQAHKMVIKEQSFTNLALGFLKILDQIIFNSELMNQGDIEAKQISLKEGHNTGTIKGDGLKLTIQEELVNAGDIVCTILAIVNGTLRNLTKGIIEVLEGITATKSHIQNCGVLRTGTENISQSFLFSQEDGEFKNEGKWFHKGNLKLDSDSISNHGSIIWRNGTLELKPVNLYNYGQWLFEHIICASAFDFQNDHTLELQDSSLTFNNLNNNKNLIFRSGQYSLIGALFNNNLISFQDHEWHFTDNDNSTAPNHLLLKGDALKNDKSLGEIESQKELTYDLKNLPTTLRSQEGVVFTPRYCSNRTLADLFRVSTNKQGKVVFYTPAITTTQNYDFAHIGHLELHVDGLFTTIHKLTAPTLMLNVNGPLTCGSSNTVMGEIASTEGPFSITAHSIDNRFGKMYGKGPTFIKTTQGNVLIGAPQKGVDEDFKKYYYAHTSFSTEGLDAFTCNILSQQREKELDAAVGCNKAYCASEDKVTIDSANDIIVDCGTIMSGKGINLKALKSIENIAGKIFSLGSTLIEGYEYKHNLKSPLFILDESSFPGEGYERPASGPAILDSLSDIHINVHKVSNFGGTVRTQGSIYVNGQALSNKTGLPYYTEEPANYLVKWTNGTQWFSKIIFSYPCIVQSGTSIHINTGNYVLSGNKHSGSITIQASGTGLFDNSKQKKHQLTITGLALIDLTSAIQTQAKENSLLHLSSTGEVSTAVSLGSPYIPLIGDQMVMLSTLDNQHLYRAPLDPSRLLNPLHSLSLGLYNLFTQATLSQVAGRVSINHASKDTLFQSLVQNGVSFGQQENKSIVTLEDVQKARHSMILPGLSQVGDQIHQILSLFVAQEDMNPIQGISADTIDVHNQGPLTVKDTTIKTKKWMHFFSEDHLSFLSIISTHLHAKGTQETLDAPTNLECEEGEIIALGKKGFRMTATKLRSLLRLMVGSLEGNSDIESAQLKRTEHSYHEKKGSIFKGNTTTHVIEETSTSHPSELTSEREEVTVLSGDTAKTTITGSLLKSVVAVIFQGKDLETHAAVGINTTTTESETDGGFSSSYAKRVSQTASFAPTVLNAPAIYTNTESAIYRGTDFIADVIYDNTKEGLTFAPSTSWLEYFHQVITSSSFLKSDVGSKGGYEAMQPCRLMVNKLIRQVDDGQITLQSVDWDKERTQIIGTFAETAYHLKSWQTSWAYHKQLIPNEALVVVALGVTLATHGWGASLINSLGESLFGLVPITTATGASVMVPAVTLSSTGMAVANAGFSAICSQLTTSMLRTGNPIESGKELISPTSMRSLAVTMASAGIMRTVSGLLELSPQPQSFEQHLKVNAVRSLVSSSLNMAIGESASGEVLQGALRSIVAGTLGGMGANEIAELYSDGQLDYLTHKLAHAFLGAGIGSILSSDAIEGAVSGAIGGVVAEMIGEEFVQQLGNKKLSTVLGEFDETVMKAQLASAFAVMLAGQDVSIATFVAENAVRNNSYLKALIQLTKSVKTGVQVLLKKEGEVAAKSVVKEGTKSTKQVARLAEKVAEKTRGIKTPAKGEGYSIQIPNGKHPIKVRIMEKGGERSTPYCRISVKDKGAVTQTGEFSSNRHLTHIELHKNSIDDIINIIKILKN